MLSKAVAEEVKDWSLVRIGRFLTAFSQKKNGGKESKLDTTRAGLKFSIGKH